MGTLNCLMRLGLHSGLTLNSPSSDGIPIKTKISLYLTTLWLKGWRSLWGCFCWGGIKVHVLIDCDPWMPCSSCLGRDWSVSLFFPVIFIFCSRLHEKSFYFFFILKHCKLYFKAFLHPYPLTVYRNNGEVLALSLYYRLPFNLCSLLPGVFNLSKVRYL